MKGVKCNHCRWLLPGVLGFLFLFIGMGTGSELFAQSNRQFVVVLDPGHGGHDPGASNGRIYEKDIVLSIAKKLGQRIAEGLPEVKILFTRKTDVFIPLHQRAAIANRAKADLFISIHADGVKDPVVKGSSVFVMGLHKNNENLEVAKRENAVITKEEDYLSSYGSFDNSTESYIKFSLMQNLFLEQSISFAGHVQHHFNERVKLKDRGVKQAGFLVLYKSAMPAVLVETGFVTHSEESKFLVSEEGQEFIVAALFEALKEYKSGLDKSTFSLKEDGVSREKEIQPEPKKPDGSDTVVQLTAEKPSGQGNYHGNKEKPTPSGGTSQGIHPIVFRIQIASSPVPLSLANPKFKGLPRLREDFLEGAYKYSFGETSDYEEALTYLAQGRKKVKDSFLVAFKNGKKIPVQQARKEVKP